MQHLVGRDVVQDDRDGFCRIQTFRYWNQLLLRQACPQPWRDAAIIIRGTGMRPGEVFSLRWENIHLNGFGGLIQITDGKTKAARRMLPMLPVVYEALKARHAGAGTPEFGWVFPSTSTEGHLNKDTAKDQHAKAIERANEKAKKTDGVKKLQHFQPYILRHTALTQLAQAGCDAFTLARIAGHSSITITQRYIHPQADAMTAHSLRWPCRSTTDVWTILISYLMLVGNTFRRTANGCGAIRLFRATQML